MRLKKIILCLVILQLLLGLHYIDASEPEDTIVVLNDFTNNENKKEQKAQNELKIYSQSAILIEEKSGKVLYEKNMNDIKYPASTTKILTAIIALEKCDLKEKATASEFAINTIKSGYSTAKIQVGETFTIGELVEVMMIQSANEAANIIAEHISGSVLEFANLMNEKAKEIGCLNSNFVNPNGVHNENHYSTAYDLALIARYCMKNDKFREIANKMECSLPNTDLYQEELRVFRNTNKLLNSQNRYYYPYCNGIKTGFTTPAKNCLISSSNKDGFETISVVLYAESTEEGLSARYLDTINLFEYGYNNYNLEDILEEYDLIEYHPDQDIQVKKQPKILFIGSTEDDESNARDTNIFKKELVMAIIGIIILFIFAIYSFYRFFRKSRKMSKKDLYNFKLN